MSSSRGGVADAIARFGASSEDTRPVGGGSLLPFSRWRLHLRDAHLHHSFDERSGQRFIDGKMNSSLRDPEGLQLVLERLDNSVRGKKAAVIRKGGKPHQHLFVLK